MSMMALFALSGPALAQDIQGLENCTAERAMERRTGCMQSNISYLNQLLTRRSADFQQKLDAANREIGDLKSVVADLRARIDALEAARKDAEKKDAANKDKPKDK
jgi:hypothetical protein